MDLATFESGMDSVIVARGREVYREICGIIQRMQSLFGTAEARAVANDLRQRYKHRRNLMEELDALESSW